MLEEERQVQEAVRLSMAEGNITDARPIEKQGTNATKGLKRKAGNGFDDIKAIRRARYQSTSGSSTQRSSKPFLLIIGDSNADIHFS
jgi:hypothetical protein